MAAPSPSDYYVWLTHLIVSPYNPAMKNTPEVPFAEINSKSRPPVNSAVLNLTHYPPAHCD